MIDVLWAAPRCSAEPSGVQARVNDLLHYHRTRGGEDVRIEVAAIGWDGPETASWPTQQIYYSNGSRVDKLLNVMSTAIAHRNVDILHLTNLPPVLRWVLPLTAPKTPMIVGPNNTGKMFPESMIDEDIISVIEQEKGDVAQRWRLYGEHRERATYWTYEHLRPGQTNYVAQSRFSEDILRERGISGDSITVLPSGVRTDIFTPEGESIPWPGQGSNDLRLLYIGRPDRRKGIDVLFDAVEMCAQSGVTPSVAIIGAAEPPGFLTDHPARDYISFEGTQPRRELAKYYRSADVFVTPSRYEAEPTVMIESLACGTPVIATDDRPFTEIGNAESCIFFNRGDPVYLCQAIRGLFNSLSRFRNGAMSHASEYDIEQTYQTIVEMYKRLVHDP